MVKQSRDRHGQAAAAATGPVAVAGSAPTGPRCGQHGLQPLPRLLALQQPGQRLCGRVRRGELLPPELQPLQLRGSFCWLQSPGGRFRRRWWGREARQRH
jgi:hypothetical protein